MNYVAQKLRRLRPNPFISGFGVHINSEMNVVVRLEKLVSGVRQERLPRTL